jgi:hypothetical protein
LIRPQVIIDMVKQVEFNHGDLKAANVLVSAEPSRGNYQGLSWNSDLSFKLADFAKSSLTIRTSTNERVRLFNYSSSAETYLSIGTNFNVSALAQIRHMGLPYYFSFDLYTLMIIPEIFKKETSRSLLRRWLSSAK